MELQAASVGTGLAASRSCTWKARLGSRCSFEEFQHAAGHVSHSCPTPSSSLLLTLVPAASPQLSGQDVLWAQRPDAVYLTIDLKEVQDIKAAVRQSVVCHRRSSKSKPGQLRCREDVLLWQGGYVFSLCFCMLCQARLLANQVGGSLYEFSLDFFAKPLESPSISPLRGFARWLLGTDCKGGVQVEHQEVGQFGRRL